MSRTRRTFSAALKSKVILGALKEKDTLEVLAKRFEGLAAISGLFDLQGSNRKIKSQTS